MGGPIETPDSCAGSIPGASCLKPREMRGPIETRPQSSLRLPRLCSRLKPREMRGPIETAPLFLVERCGGVGSQAARNARPY